MAYGYTLEAEYESGYIHSELMLGDRSPYVEGANIFNDIIQHRPRQEHGRLVRFSAIGPKRTYHIDFSDMPDNAKPIRFMRKSATISQQLVAGFGWQTDGPIEYRLDSYHFGYEYHDPDGTKHKEIIELEL